MRPTLSAVLACLLVAGLAPALHADDVVAPSFEAMSTSGSSDYRQVVDLTYPTAPGTTYRDDYTTSRGSTRAHRATDVFGPTGQRVHAAQAGQIVWMPGQDPPGKHATAGYGLQIRGVDGRVYAYYHLGPDSEGPASALAAGLEKGDRVERGQHIGYLGDSGNAAGGSPHLHFEIHDDRVADPYGTNRINPYDSLRDAERRGDYPQGGAAQPGPSAPGTGAGPDVDPTAAVDRVSGSNRVATAIELSRAAYDSADHVVLASGDSFADSVTAGPLAAVRGGPVLTTRTSSLEPAVIDELRRLGATRVTVVGGEAAVPGRVERDLVTGVDLAPSRVDRLAGRTRFETAAAVAGAVWAAGGERDARVALGEHEEEQRAWPDALAAGYHGAVTGAPVLLVSPGRVPEATAAALDGVREATVVGGSAVVPENTYAQIGARVGSIRRLSGPDRYLTAAAVAADVAPGTVSLSRVWVATGHDFADALAASAAVAATGETLLLVDGRARGGDDRLEPWLRERADQIERGRVVGGSAAVTDDALRLLAERIRG